MHPVEKILVEETGVQTPEEAKPLLKKYWANKIADMSPEQIEKLKGKSKLIFSYQNHISKFQSKYS